MNVYLLISFHPKSLKHKEPANYIQVMKSASYWEENRTFKCLKQEVERTGDPVRSYNFPTILLFVHRSAQFEEAVQYHELRMNIQCVKMLVQE